MNELVQPILITVVTPSYNRFHTLPALYNSLQAQTSKCFEWLIVDDGSTDDTEALVETFIPDNYKLRYIKKENGGKHTALNVAFLNVYTPLTFIVDSDDVLTPDAIATIAHDWSLVENKGLCGISYLRGYSAVKPIGDIHPHDWAVDNFIQLRFNQNVGGDKAEVWVTKLLQQYRYPVFEGEKFFGESYIWCKLAEKYDMLMRNQIIYITKYLEGGLSQSGRALRIRCPRGGMTNALVMMAPGFSVRQRIKGGILYNCYASFAAYSMKERFNNIYPLLTIFTWPFGLVLYYRWKRFQ